MTEMTPDELRYARRTVARNRLHDAVKSALEHGLSGEDVLDEIADLVDSMDDPRPEEAEVTPWGPETDRGGLIGQQPY